MNLFENLQLLKENENHKYWMYTGNVYKNNMKNKIKIGEIKKPIYVTAPHIGAAYHGFINDIITHNRLFDIKNSIQLDKENIKNIDKLPDNADDNMTCIIE